MKKKLIATLSIALVALMVIGGTLAYFTDTDEAKNVMTLGNVDIEQNEYERDANGGLVQFTQNKALIPMVDTRENTGANPVVDGYFDEGLKNDVDKIITVTNNGSVDAYVRTIILFETGIEYKAGTNEINRDGVEIFKTYLGTLTSGVDFLYDLGTIEVDGKNYIAAVKVYEDVLAPGAESTPSLKQIFMAPTAGNEIVALFGETYEILALSQGVQEDGFATAEEALDTAFGEVTVANIQAWF